MKLAEVQRQIAELEPKLERLRALYEQYFLGFEKIPPNVLRKEVDRTLWQLRRSPTKNTRLRFKLNQLVQRYNTYQQYWQRTMRQIERGTYRRDVIRAARKVGREEAAIVGGRQARSALRGLDEGPLPSGVSSADSQAPGSENPESARARRYSSRPPPRRQTPATGSDFNTRKLYDEYVRARRAAGQSTTALTYDKLQKRLSQQARKLRRKHGRDKDIDFVVAMKDGKPVLRPIVR